MIHAPQTGDVVKVSNVQLGQGRRRRPTRLIPAALAVPAHYGRRSCRASTSNRSAHWLVANIPGAVAPFTFDLIAGGRSNLTFTVTGADGTRFVLRRPPLGHVLATAHDMAREHRIIAAVGRTNVPVPPRWVCAPTRR